MFAQDSFYFIPVIIIAVTPSLIWLFFYLMEDRHPEPKYWLATIFLMGVALAPLVIFLEMFATNFFGRFETFAGLKSSLLLFIIAPLIEELAKYGAVHLTLNKNPVLDEPVDGMVYLVAAALGFAAIENVIATFSLIPSGTPQFLNAAFSFVSLRFISAVALHGLASAIMGYYFALFYFIKRKKYLIFKGLFYAAALHGAYNFLIIREEREFLLLAGLLLGGAAAAVIHLFNRLNSRETYQQIFVDETPEYKI